MSCVTKLWGILALALAAQALPVAAQDAPGTPSYTLSGTTSWAGMAAWSDDGDFQAADVLYGSDAALELSLLTRRPGIRAEFAGQVDVLAGLAAAPASVGGMEVSGSMVATTTDNAYALVLTVDRAYLKWSPELLSVTAGRQVVNWGNALLWSPADLFAETKIVGLGPERAGTDALRVGAAIGALGGLEAVVAPGAAFSAGRYGGRLYGSALGSDLGVQAAWDGKAGSTTIAANLKTDLIVGLWVEASYTLFEDETAAERLEAVAGLDWSLGQGLVLSAEYRYNPEGLAGEAFPAIHFLYGSASLKAGDFASLGLMLLADAGNGIVSGTLSAIVDVAQDASMTTWIQYANGNMATLSDLDSAGAGLTLSLAF